jgi:hypothetical protein
VGEVGNAEGRMKNAELDCSFKIFKIADFRFQNPDKIFGDQFAKISIA